MSRSIPLDDGELEMEELEGLVRISSPKPPPGQRGLPKHKVTLARCGNEISKRCHRVLSRPKSRNRLLLLGLLLLVVVVFLMTRVDETAEAAEQSLESGEEQAKNATATVIYIPEETSSSPEDPHVEEPRNEETGESTTTTTEEDGERNQSETTPTEEIPVETPVETPEEKPAEVIPEEKPAETPPVAAPVEAPKEAPVAPPVEPPKEAPLAPPVEPPKEAPVEPPKEAPVEPPVEPPKEAPVAAPVAPPVEPPVEPPKEATTTKPAEVDDGGWGHWKFFDGAEEERPSEDQYKWDDYPNRDLPSDKFPADAWQSDAVYVNHFLEEAQKLVSRVKEAILTEYGHGLPRTPEQSVEAQKMFKIEMLDFAKGDFLQKGGRSGPAEWMFHGGWTTERSMEGLARRLLHAMITHDTFTFNMAGHSSAAGHGNHFSQSYMMQFHQLMEPIFARLGMTLKSHNFAQGGLGTMHNVLGSRHIYGSEIDVMLWDTAMTENQSHELDLFYRQVLLSGNRVPFIMCYGCDSNVLKMLHEEADVDVSSIGDGTYGIPEVQDAIQALEIPWAARYMKCSHESVELCKQNKYNGTCWIERDDVTPVVKQLGTVPGAASWHPGWRSHQLQGRVLAIWILDALYDALQLWQDITMVGGDPLEDSYWHMSPRYETTRQKLQSMPDANCEGAAEAVGYPSRVCRIPLNGRTEFTPRHDPDHTSIRAIMVPPADATFMPKAPEELYTQPDVPIPAFSVPEGALDVKKIVSNRRQRQLATMHDHAPASRMTLESAYGRKPGKGWELGGAPAGFCDGSMDSRCGRQASQDCLLRRHNDNRAVLTGDGLSGWLLLKLGKVTAGIILLHIEIWHGGPTVTAPWTAVNDGEYERRRHLRSTNSTTTVRRELGGAPHFLQDDFQFEIAINDNVTILDKDTFLAAQKKYQRVLEVITLLDDPEWKETDVELGLRVKGCQRDLASDPHMHCSVNIGHVYWA